MKEVDKVNQLAWRKFLQSQAGEQGLLFLRERQPVVTKGQMHEMVFDAGRVRGYNDVLDQITNLLGGETKETINIENK